MIGNTILLAFREIRRNVMRSILTILGIIIGTLSSIFVASPVVALWRGEKMIEVKR